MKRLIPSAVFGIALFLLPGLAWGQQGTVTGTVTEADSEQPLPGATVQVVEVGTGAATDGEGQYRITGVPAGEQTIQVSFVGYQEQERTITVPENGTVRANFQLQPSTAQLQEVTVSAYRPETDEVDAGAASGIEAQNIESVNPASAEGALQGRAAGVRVQSTSGQPGAGFSVNVRGAASVNAGTDPLYVVDGVQINKEDNASFSNANPLSSLNPSDIESIQVLKDASAAAIYGAQAANGVVVIETKDGQAGDTRINFSTRLGSINEINRFDVMNSEQYMDYLGEATNNALQARFGTTLEGLTGGSLTARGFNNQVFGPDSINTDWPGAVFRSGLTQTYNASISGGDEATQFRVSGRFTREEAQAISSSFRQGQLRAKVNNQTTDYLNLSGNINVATNKIEGVNEADVNVNSPFFTAFAQRPTRSIYNEPGNPSSGFNLFDATFPNQIAQQNFNTRESNSNSVNASVEANWDLPRGFSARSFAGTQYEDLEEPFFADPRLPGNQDGDGNPVGTGIYVTQRDISFNVSQSLAYDNVFSNVHQVSGLVGAELKRNKEIFSSQDGEQFPNELFRTLSSAATPTSVSTSSTQFRQQSLFGNASYTYDNTYKIGSTLRYDGSSRFGDEEQYGVFWTVSGYWRLSNEAFLEDADFLSNLKLRASYGVTGNNQIGDFQSLQQFSGAGEYAGLPGIRPTNIGNPNLTWEEKKSVNIGLDYGLFGGRIQGAVDVWRDNRDALLLNRDLPLDSGFGSILENVGEIRVQGVDASITTTNLDDWNGLTWTTNFNITFQDAEVQELLPDDGELGGFTTYREGRSPAQLRLVRYAGVNPANGRPMYLDANGDLTYTSQDPGDQKLLGNSNSDFFGGFENTFSFKGLTVSGFFQYDYGRRAYANDQFFLNVPYFTFNKNAALLDRWKEPGDITEVPKAFGSLLGPSLGVGDLTLYNDGTDPQSTFDSSRFIQNASYIRLKQVRISYSLPESLIGGLSQLRSLEVFAQGSNLVTWTNYTGPDPESVGNVTTTVFPQGRSYTAGVNVGL